VRQAGTSGCSGTWATARSGGPSETRPTRTRTVPNVSQPRNGPDRTIRRSWRARGVQMKVLKWTAATGAIAVGTILLLSKNDIQRIVRMHAM
jgi:hypothetical protein